MTTYNLQLLDFPGNYEKGTLPHGPRAYIALKTSSTVSWRDKTGTKDIDFTVISPDCVTIDEFHYQVKQLITMSNRNQFAFHTGLEPVTSKP